MTHHRKGEGHGTAWLPTVIGRDDKRDGQAWTRPPPYKEGHVEEIVLSFCNDKIKKSGIWSEKGQEGTE